MLPFTIFQIIFANILLHKISAAPYETFEETDEVLVKTTTSGNTVVLGCRSNDPKHNFLYWHFVNKGLVIGPSNKYDNVKYRFEILSGNLTIRGISKHEQGLYECVSRAVNGNDLNIKMVKIMVESNGGWQQNSSSDDEYNLMIIKILIVLIVLVMVAAGGFFTYKSWTDKSRYTRYMETNNDDDDDDDDSTEELFRAPSTSKSNTMPKKNIVQNKFQREDAFANVDISTDFKSILDTANDK